MKKKLIFSGIFLLVTLFVGIGCDEEKIHNYKITDFSTGKTYNVSCCDITNSTKFSENLGPGCRFITSDGSKVEIDNSFSISQVD